MSMAGAVDCNRELRLAPHTQNSVRCANAGLRRKWKQIPAKHEQSENHKVSPAEHRVTISIPE